MAASIVQSGNASAKPGGTFTNPFGTLIGASAVTPGNTILAMVGYTYDTVATTFTCTDTLLQTYTLVDYLSKSGDFNASLFICQNSLAMPAPVAKTLTGSLSVGAGSATLSAAWSGSTAVYIITFSSGEVRPVNLTNGSTSMTWPDGLGSAATSSITVGYGPYFQGTNDGDFGLAVAVEVTGVPTSGVLVAHNAAINSAVAIGSNNINSGSLACGSGSGLMVSILLNVGNGNASPTFTPKVGTSPVSFTKFGSSFWDFGSSALGILQYAHLNAPGTLTPTGGTQETVADEYFVWAVFLADAAATPFVPPDIYERTSPKPSLPDFTTPNLLADQVLKLPPFVQKELPGWMPKRMVVTDFHPPNLLADQILKPPPITQTDLLYKVQWKGIYTDFNPPNLLADQVLKPPPVAPIDLSARIQLKAVAPDFIIPNLLPALLPKPPVAPVDATVSIRAKGVFTDFSPPNVALSTLAAIAPTHPTEAFLRLEYRWTRGDDIPLNSLVLAQAAVTPLLPQDISGLRLDARGVRSDFAPPNLTLFLPVPPPPPVFAPAGRHGTRVQARHRRERDVLRAKVEAFKERLKEADAQLEAMESREIKERTKVLKRVRIRYPDLTRGLKKPLEQYAPVKRAIENRNEALASYREILNHLARAQNDERLLREQEDDEAALHLMHLLMWEEFRE